MVSVRRGKPRSVSKGRSATKRDRVVRQGGATLRYALEMYDRQAKRCVECSESFLIDVSNTAELRLVEDGIRAFLRSVHGTVVTEPDSPVSPVT